MYSPWFVPISTPLSRCRAPGYVYVAYSNNVLCLLTLHTPCSKTVLFSYYPVTSNGDSEIEIGDIILGKKAN